MFSYFVGTVKRLFLFSFFFLFAYLHYKTTDKSSYEFKDKVFEFSTLINFKSARLEKFLDKPEHAFKIFLIFQTTCALLAVLGLRFFSFVSGLCLLFLNALYYNPLRINPATIKPDMVITYLNLDHIKNLSWEFIILIILSLAIFTQSFRYSCFKKTVIYSQNVETKEFNQEIKREAKVTSQKKKKI
jgi:hypothetical protein